MELIKNTKNIWWGIFKTGTFTDMNGKEFKADSSTLDKIIDATKNFNYQNDEIPIVIGHPKIDDPKWGSVKKVNVKKGKEFLYAKPFELVKEFSDMVKNKMFDKISISLRPDLSIKHIGLLGAAAPAVTGLPPVSFSENEKDRTIDLAEFQEFQLSSYWTGSITQMFRGIKNKFIELYGADEADNLMPEYLLQDISNGPVIYSNEPDGDEISAYSENNKTKKSIKDDQMEKEELEKQNKEFSEKNSQLENDLKAEREKNAKIEKEKRLNEIRSFMSSEEMTKRISPALKPHVENILIALESGQEYSFSEGDKEVKSIPAEGFKKVLAALPVLTTKDFASKENAKDENIDDVDTSEFAGMNVDESSMEIHIKASKLMKGNDKLTYPEAVKQAYKG